jgi:hypothetical protein
MLNKPILITGVGGPTPRSFAIALKRYSRRNSVTLIGTDANPLAIGLYARDLFQKTYLVPRADNLDYWPAIERIVRENQIEIAIILPETEVRTWSERLQKTSLPCATLLPDLALVDLLIDKAKMTTVLADDGCVPVSVSFSRSNLDVKIIREVLKFPFWVRSITGTSGLGSLKIENDESLLNWIRINPEVNHFLASKFLPGRNLACKLLYFDGKLLRSACAERVNYIMSKVAPSGITGNTAFGRLLNEPALVDIATKAMEKLFSYSHAKKHGFFTVDFKEDESGNPFITEINVRHVAFTQCFAAAGANFADDTLRLLQSDPDFDYTYKMYEFEKDLIFLRDVDSHPVLMKEHELLRLQG